MRHRGVTAGVAAVIAALGLALVGTASGGAAATGCVVKGHAISGVGHSRVVARRGAVVVYRIRGHRADGYWACRQGGTRRVRIGRDDGHQSNNAEYGPSATIGDIQIAGSFVTAIQETGADMFDGCTKYGFFPCPSPVDTLVAVRVATGARGPMTVVDTDPTDAMGYGPSITWARTLLSGAGGVAWLLSSMENTPTGPAPTVLTLYGCVATAAGATLGCTPRQLAQGAIDPASLAISGTTLTWITAGAPQSASLS
jgi:hypothetical protein